jgi:hypothetical protein
MRRPTVDLAHRAPAFPASRVMHAADHCHDRVAVGSRLGTCEGQASWGARWRSGMCPQWHINGTRNLFSKRHILFREHPSQDSEGL